MTCLVLQSLKDEAELFGAESTSISSSAQVLKDEKENLQIAQGFWKVCEEIKYK